MTCTCMMEGSFKQETYIIKSFIVLFYFSTATMTGAGFGDIYPTAWYLYLITIMQMLLGVVYAVAILGRGFSLITNGKDVLSGSEAAEEEAASMAASAEDGEGGVRTEGDGDGDGDGGESGGGSAGEGADSVSKPHSGGT